MSLRRVKWWVLGVAAIPRLLADIHTRLATLEITMSDLREDFDETLAELGSAITDLATRIETLPDANDITQADIDGLKGLVGRVNDIATASPSVPTGDQGNADVAPGEAGTAGEDEVSPAQRVDAGPVIGDTSEAGTSGARVTGSGEQV